MSIHFVFHLLSVLILLRLTLCEDEIGTVEVDSNGDTAQCTSEDCPSNLETNAWELDRSHLKLSPNLTNHNAQSVPSILMENLSDEPVLLWWDAGYGENPIEQGYFKPKDSKYINSYIGHRFYFTTEEDKSFRLQEFTVQPNVHNFTLFTTNLNENLKIQATKKRADKAFKQAYKDDPNRYDDKWSNFVDRGEVSQFMYDIRNIGQIINSKSFRPRYIKLYDDNNSSFPKNEELLNDKIMQDFIEWGRENRRLPTEYNNEGKVPPPFMRYEYDNNIIFFYNHSIYHRYKVSIDDNPQILLNPNLDDYSLDFRMEVVCNKPRVVQIKDFLSDDEAQHIIEVGSYMGLNRSTLGAEAVVNSERTSSTTWINREVSPIIDDVFKRIADVLLINEWRLHVNDTSESLQLVHYHEKEWYRKHLDWNADPIQFPNNRFITFLMYLNDVDNNSGHTSFPDASNECKNEDGYFGLNPGKGNVLFFYNLHPDGNTDPYALHQAEPPQGENSEKWMTNLWIWDPFYPLHSKRYRKK